MISIGRLTWYNGYIPEREISVKIGSDKGGDVLNTTKMNFLIINVPAPNSVSNTCVFSCFKAADTVLNLHIALDRFKAQVRQLLGMKWRYR